MMRVGLLGAGHFAKAHVAALGQMTDAIRVTRYARRDEAAAFPEAEEVGAARMGVDELLASDDVDAVLVCVPNYLHRAFAQQALRAGKHVFCEKPLALNVADANAVLATARETDRVLMVGHLTRHLPAYVMVGDILAEGRLGLPVAAYASRMHSAGTDRPWRMDADLGGGVAFDLLVHDLDLLNWYLGHPESVVARGRRHASGGYAYVAATFNYADHKIALAEGGFVFCPPAGLRATLRVVCEQGHIEVNAHDKEAPIRVFEEGREEERVSVKTEDLLIDGLKAEWAEFIQSIDGNPDGRLRTEDARWVVACADAVVRAADTGDEAMVRCRTDCS